MSLKDFVRLSQSEILVAQFQENAIAGSRYRVVLVGGDAVEGIPTAPPGTPLEFRIRTEDGAAFRIPFTEVVDAERLRLDDNYFMGLAIKASRKCRPEAGRQSRVPKVGAVLVVDGRAVGSAYRNEHIDGDKGDEGDHAEMTLLEKKLKDAENIAGATLYTTLEPCCSERRHPNRPCTTHIISRRIGKVVIGILDPNQAICGKGVWRLREAGIDVSLCDAALTRQIEDVNREFIMEYRGTMEAVPSKTPSSPGTVPSTPGVVAPSATSFTTLTRAAPEVWIRRATMQVDPNTKCGRAAVIDLGATDAMDLDLERLSVGLNPLASGTGMWLKASEGDTLILSGNTLTVRPNHLRQKPFDDIAKEVSSNRVVQVVLAGSDGHTIVRSDGLGYEAKG